jgi:hypothetical protein
MRLRPTHAAAGLLVTSCLALLLGIQTLQAADDGGGQPLACIGQQTFFPRGNRWAVDPNAPIVLQMQKDGPSQQTGPLAIAANVANNAVASAFGVWTSTVCSNPPNSSPNVAFAVGPVYATRDNGDDPARGVYKNIVWWVIDPNLWHADTATVALTTDSYYPDTGVNVDGDLAFNGINFNWRVVDAQTGSSYGCNKADPNCFDVQSVALHEAGHFLGFNHISCSGALMAPTQLPNPPTAVRTLSLHETAGLCALYPPRSGQSSVDGHVFGEKCAVTADCSTGLTCLQSASVVGAVASGICASPCSSSNDCPLAYTCGPVGAYGNFCSPGVHLAGVPVQSATAVGDLCKGCLDGTTCLSGVCGILGSGAGAQGICTQSCAAPAYACPAGFSCTSATQSLNICWPIAAGQCAITYTGEPLNAVCRRPAGATGTSSAIAEPCQAGLSCFIFPSQVGSCVNSCSSVDSSIHCGTGFTCCYGIDTAGGCAKSSAAKTQGGCFQLRHAGDSCVQANQSVCDSSTQCLYTEDPTLAKCYHMCPTGTCPSSEETCVPLPGSQPAAGATGGGVCCQTKTFAAGDFATCVPQPGPCPRQLGVTCSVDADCTSGLCLKYQGGAACSVACRSAADCPGVSVDVNEDGVPDGGSACLPIGIGTQCWPNTGPLPPPACAVTATAAAAAVQHGCGCSSTQPSAAWPLAVLAACICQRLHRRRAKLS